MPHCETQRLAQTAKKGTVPISRALTIGHFDGVHLGHRALVRAAREAAGPQGKVIVLAFDPHPLSVLRPADAPVRLSRFERRREWLLEAGADEVERLSPTRELLAQTSESFLAGLVGRHRPAAIVEGPDFHFGRDRSGSVQTIRDLAATHGYRAIVVDQVERALADHTIVPVRSSLVRWLVAAGRVRDAALLLGRPYELQGPVVGGEGRGGRDLGVPTANLDHDDLLLPADGIYAGRARAPDGTVYAAAISVGTKPTFGRHPRLCEAHLIGYGGVPGHYGWTLTLEFHEWLRDQIRYTGPGPLIEQLQRDIERAAQTLGELAPTP